MQLLCQGGYRNETLTSAVSVLNTEQMKWLQPNVKDGAISPGARVGHAVVCIRERIYMFGGLTEQGLTNETWVRSYNTKLLESVIYTLRQCQQWSGFSCHNSQPSRCLHRRMNLHVIFYKTSAVGVT